MENGGLEPYRLALGARSATYQLVTLAEWDTQSLLYSTAVLHFYAKTAMHELCNLS